MYVESQNVSATQFFATKDKPPGNIFMMCVAPTKIDKGLAQNIDTEEYWNIKYGYWCWLVPEHEYDKQAIHA